jgi:hypothetical protein
MDSPLKANELCRIIKACRESGVAKLRLGSVELEFYKSDSYNPLELPKLGHSQVSKTIKKNSLQQEIPTEMVYFPEQEDELKEEMHAQLLIDDPSSFEEQMIYENLASANTEGERYGFEDSRPRENLS